MIGAQRGGRWGCRPPPRPSSVPSAVAEAALQEAIPPGLFSCSKLVGIVYTIDCTSQWCTGKRQSPALVSLAETSTLARATPQAVCIARQLAMEVLASAAEEVAEQRVAPPAPDSTSEPQEGGESSGEGEQQPGGGRAAASAAAGGARQQGAKRKRGAPPEACPFCGHGYTVRDGLSTRLDGAGNRMHLRRCQCRRKTPPCKNCPECKKRSDHHGAVRRPRHAARL